jgi:predicted amidohydrolase
MADIVTIGLVQAHHETDGAEPVEKHKRAAIEKHVAMIRDAAKRGAQIVCLQELFYGPYFCTEQNPKWYDATELVPDGPTTRLMQDLAKELGIALVVPLYERTISGVYYNTAVVIDADGTVLGIYRKHHIPQVAAGPAHRRLHLLRSPLPRGRATARAQRRGDRLQPLGDGRRALGISLEARAARARGGQRLLRRRDQSRRLRNAVEHG